MEKLIELLNEYWEYDLVEHNWEICKWDTDDEWEINIYTDYTNNIISKKFWFIKWLVENDKISNDWIKPRTDLVKEITIVDYKTGDAIWWKNKYTEVEQLIMYLSIQDEPINFLISILK